MLLLLNLNKNCNVLTNFSKFHGIKYHENSLSSSRAVVYDQAGRQTWRSSQVQFATFHFKITRSD
jgi:hypothetical protein